MNLGKYQHIYFIGIGGIGMSALARYFHTGGKTVAGYDRTPSELTDELAREGIHIHFTDDITAIPSAFLDQNNTLVVYTPAVPADHTELNYFRQQGFAVEKRSKVLGMVMSEKYAIAVAGTHGKTTTSSMVAHILKHSGSNVTAFLGGITANYHTNYITSASTDIVVAEADEFDRSFLQIHPDLSIITSTDADHLDIYGQSTELENTYSAFAEQLKPGGKLYYQKNARIAPAPGRYTYSSFEKAYLEIEQFEVVAGRFEFEVIKGGISLGHFSLGMPGRHNVENVLAAIGVAHDTGLAADKIREAVYTYKGVKRRFEVIENASVAYIDDYAHHPTEIAAFIHGLRDLYPGRHITGIFQPHLYSRTRDFADGFAESLSQLDRLVLLDIYPARELPMEGVSSEMVFQHATTEDKVLLKKEDLMEYLRKNQDSLDVLATIGAGDIDRFVKPIGEMIHQLNRQKA